MHKMHIEPNRKNLLNKCMYADYSNMPTWTTRDNTVTLNHPNLIPGGQNPKQKVAYVALEFDGNSGNNCTKMVISLQLNRSLTQIQKWNVEIDIKGRKQLYNHLKKNHSSH